MHEFGIAEAVLDAVEHRAKGRRVRRARVRAGALLRISPAVLKQAFGLAATGTVAEGATLDLVVEPVRLVCRGCGHNALCDNPMTICGECGGIDIDAEGGDRLVLESVQIVEAAHVPGDSGRDRGDPVRSA
ncbi:hydrogenase maturation nickel metallochaperone HypA [Microbispora triticiradicis]|uniref:Hydrogenase maturation factor HypA n=2 Tax=Microbispora TaxID=2005 RepID=A0ABY3LTA1_9ACTN|nr:MULTISPECIES: hydrogenase maturation nickel metallochaperone HypA [Microbispora]TLP65987.1 hydrogenase maturation nickel metallochaperone HypA [Microbispora fusca]TYB53269.1 hydrogenase maturation nickel metallochaperone HypA [Microbispora tritici]